MSRRQRQMQRAGALSLLSPGNFGRPRLSPTFQIPPPKGWTKSATGPAGTLWKFSAPISTNNARPLEIVVKAPGETVALRLFEYPHGLLLKQILIGNHQFGWTTEAGNTVGGSFGSEEILNGCDRSFQPILRNNIPIRFVFQNIQGGSVSGAFELEALTISPAIRQLCSESA